MPILLRQPGLVAALVAALAGCAHAPPAGPRAEVAYPPPPAAPQARYAGAIPGEAFEPPRPSALRRLTDLVVGLDAAQAAPLFDQPFGLGATPGGELLVADPDRPQVLRLDLAGQRLSAVECRGHAWVAPLAVTADEAGSIYVADAGAALVARVDADGACALLGRGELTRPSGVAARAGKVYAADPPRHAVLVLTREGALLARLEAAGEPGEPLGFPSAVALDAGGALLVVDALGARLLRIDEAGRLLGTPGGPEAERGGLARPKAVALDARGRAFVSDGERARVVALDPSGLAGFWLGGPGDGPADLSLPAGLAVIGSRLFVADGPRRRIQVYDLLGASS